MRLIFQKKDMLQSLLGAEVVVSEKMGFSVSSTVQIVAEGDDIFIQAFNGEVSYKSQIKGDVQSPGSVCLSHNKFLLLVREMSEGDLMLECKEDHLCQLNPKEGKRKLKTVIKGIPADKLSTLPDVDDKNTFISIEKTHLKKMISKVAFAVSAQATRYALNGVFLEVKKNRLVMVASDGRRLAVCQTFLADAVKQSFQAILSQVFVNNLQRQLMGDGPVQLFYEKNRVFFGFDKTFVSSAQMDGTYPEYNNFIPQKTKHHFTANVKELLDAISMGSVFHDNASTQKIVLTVSAKELSLESKEKNYGQTNEKIAIDYDGEEYQIGFNARMLLEMVRNIQTEQVEFHFDDGEAPVLIKPVSSEDYQYVLMPMRIQA